MPLVAFALIVSYLYDDPSAWDFVDLRDEVAWIYEESIEAAWYFTFEHLARMTRSDLLPDCGNVTVEAFVRARVILATQFLMGMSMEEFWAFEFEPSLAFMEAYPEFMISLPTLPRPSIPPTWLEPPGATCDRCGSRNAMLHHTGELLCENCVDNHFFGCW